MKRELVSQSRPEFYTVSQLASMLQVTEMTIYRMVRRGELPCHSIGRAKRFRQSDIEAFLKGVRTFNGARTEM
ncbi:MAG: helix-turn-helix domain-containing protein [Candidatus Binataceae bacterium]|nr:helix-turn-helix domain-containing protein [Candidatus Binataceae bacterium]